MNQIELEYHPELPAGATFTPQEAVWKTKYENQCAENRKLLDKLHDARSELSITRQQLHDANAKFDLKLYPTDLIPQVNWQEKFEHLLVERDNLLEQLHETRDQCDAAVIAAKSLGADLLAARAKLREARYNDAQSLPATCILCGLHSALSDVDLHNLALQLTLIGQMCEEQENGADGRLAHEAANVVSLTARALCDWDQL